MNNLNPLYILQEALSVEVKEPIKYTFGLLSRTKNGKISHKMARKLSDSVVGGVGYKAKEMKRHGKDAAQKFGELKKLEKRIGKTKDPYKKDALKINAKYTKAGALDSVGLGKYHSIDNAVNPPTIYKK
jgi:hypothetical protein